MHTAEVKVALGWYIGNVGGDASLSAQSPDGRRCGRVVDCYQYHGGVVEVRLLELAIYVGYLSLGDTEGNFGIEARSGADNGDVSVSVKAIEDATGGDLDFNVVVFRMGA